jgi:hypothetical protein
MQDLDNLSNYQIFEEVFNEAIDEIGLTSLAAMVSKKWASYPAHIQQDPELARRATDANQELFVVAALIVIKESGTDGEH